MIAIGVIIIVLIVLFIGGGFLLLFKDRYEKKNWKI